MHMHSGAASYVCVDLVETEIIRISVSLVCP